MAHLLSYRRPLDEAARIFRIRPLFRAYRRKAGDLPEIEHPEDIHHDRLLRAVSYHHQFRFDRQRGFTDIEFRGLPVLRAGSDRLKLPVGGNSRLGIPDEPTAVTLFQSDDADILNVLQQYGKPLVAPFRGLTAHQLHHLLFQLHARKALGGGITAEKVVYGIALGRGQPRKEQYQNQQ